jgi:hypothetical protein
MAKGEQPAAAPLRVGDRDPTRPAEYVADDVAALHALATGSASAEQQVRALRWIVEAAADAYGLSFRAGDQSSTAFAEGRRFVGLQVVKMTKMPIAPIRAREAEATRMAVAVKPKSQKKDRT